MPERGTFLLRMKFYRNSWGLPLGKKRIGIWGGPEQETLGVGEPSALADDTPPPGPPAKLEGTAPKPPSTLGRGMGSVGYGTGRGRVGRYIARSEPPAPSSAAGASLEASASSSQPFLWRRGRSCQVPSLGLQRQPGSAGAPLTTRRRFFLMPISSEVRLLCNKRVCWAEPHLALNSRKAAPVRFHTGLRRILLLPANVCKGGKTPANIMVLSIFTCLSIYLFRFIPRPPRKRAQGESQHTGKNI